MSAPDVDPIIAAAQERLRVAADLIGRGRDELREVMRSLRQHPDVKRTERRFGRYPPPSAHTLAWWLYDGTHSTMFDMDLDGAPELLRDDADPELLAAGMREFAEQAAADEAEFARKRKRHGGGLNKGRPGPGRGKAGSTAAPAFSTPTLTGVQTSGKKRTAVVQATA